MTKERSEEIQIQESKLVEVLKNLVVEDENIWTKPEEIRASELRNIRKKIAETFLELGNLYLHEVEIDVAKSVKYKATALNEAAIFANYAISIANQHDLTEIESVSREFLVAIQSKLYETVKVTALSYEENLPAFMAQRDKAQLSTLRDYCKDKLAEIEAGYEAIRGDSEDERLIVAAEGYEIVEVTELYEKINQDFKALFAQIILECESILGVPPRQYAVIGLGSLALQQFTPYSDLEFAILIGLKPTVPKTTQGSDGVEESKGLTNSERLEARKERARLKLENAKDYFRNLTQLIHFRIINLGETVIPYSKFGLTLDKYIKRGVSFDLGGKTPLGRPDKPYELIQDVVTMSKYLDHKNSAARKIAIILAFGGTGKSTLAAECLEQAKTSGVTVRWFGSSKIISGYRDMAEELGIYTEKQEPQLIRRMTNAKLKSKMGERFLFVFDNLDKENYEEVQDYIEELPNNVSLIITTRDRALPRARGATLLELQPFDELESKLYISKEFENNTDQTISTTKQELLIRAIGTLPLRLSLACAALIDDETMEIEDYIALYQSMQADGKEHPEIEIVLGQLFKKGEKGKAGWKLLQYSSYLDPDFVPMMIFKDSQLLDATELSEGTKALKSLSLITVTTGRNDAKGFRMHRFVKQETQSYANMPRQRDFSLPKLDILSSLIERVSVVFPYCSRTPTIEWDNVRLLANSTMLLLKDNLDEIIYSSYNMVKIEAARLLQRLGLYADYIECNYSKALDFHNKALEVREVAYKGSPNLEIASSLNFIGTNYLSMGDPSKASIYFKRSLDMRERLGVNKLDIIQSLSNLGGCYRDLARFDEAKSCLERALILCEEIHLKNHPHLGFCLNTLGMIYESAGDINKAIGFFQRALDLREETAPDSEEVAETLGNLALCYSNNGKTKQAFLYLNRALKILNELYQNGHPAIGCILQNFGSVYEQEKKFSEALVWYERALEMKLRFYKTNHPDVALNLHNISSMYFATGKNEKALQYAKQALQMWQNICSDERPHPQLAESLSSVGYCYLGLGKYEESRVNLSKSLAMFRVCYPPEHPHTKAVSDALGLLSMMTSMMPQSSVTSSMQAQSSVISSNQKHIEHLTVLAKGGDIVSQKELAAMYDQEKKWKEAVYWYKASAKRQFSVLLREAKEGIVVSQYLVGFMYYNGLGVNRDCTQALYWYKIAAKAGDLDAQCDLGMHYEVKSEHSLALTFYQKAGQLGHLDAQQRHQYLMAAINKTSTGETQTKGDDGSGCKRDETFVARVVPQNAERRR